MVSEWIKVEHVTPDKPELVVISSALGFDDTDVVLGKLIRLWIWADRQSLNGNALSVTEKWIDRYVHCPGFASAMRKCGWLTGEDGKISFPNFDVHNGNTAKKRSLTNRRVAKLRNAPSVTPALQKALPEEEEDISIYGFNSSSLEPLDTGSTLEKDPSSLQRFLPKYWKTVVPRPLDVPEFWPMWERWVAYRAANSKLLSEFSLIQNIQKLLGRLQVGGIELVLADLGVSLERLSTGDIYSSRLVRGDVEADREPIKIAKKTPPKPVDRSIAQKNREEAKRLRGLVQSGKSPD